MPAKLACELKGNDKPEPTTEIKFPLVFIPWAPVPGGPLPLDLWLSKQASIITTSKKLGGTYLVYQLTSEEIAAVSVAYPPPKTAGAFRPIRERPVRRAAGFVKKNAKPCRI